MRSETERYFEILLNQSRIGGYESEFRFDPNRRYRFDYCWPDKRVAVEIDGGVWKSGGGRHGRDADREKLNLAAAQGWYVLRFSKDMLERDPWNCIEMLKQALGQKEEEVKMGCDIYDVEGGQVSFTESDRFPCLCTFPDNDGGEMTVERLASLALLGAAVVMLHRQRLSGCSIHAAYVPDDLPQWIVEEIGRICTL